MSQDLKARYFGIWEQTCSAFAHLLKANTYESCGELVQRFLAACGDPDLGHVGKTAGDSGKWIPTGFTAHFERGFDSTLYMIVGVSHDVVFHRGLNLQIDLLAGAAARSDPRPEIWQDAKPIWDEIPVSSYRASNPWVAAIPVGAAQAAPAAPSGIPAYPSNEADVDDAGAKLFADFASAGQAPNPQMFRFAFRTAFDWLSRNEPSIAASVAKHRAEWRGLLGLPPL